jgi:hypothetical protein
LSKERLVEQASGAMPIPMREDNPYDWRSDRPEHLVERRALLTQVGERILRGQSGYLVGCHGMGKTVFLRQLESYLRRPGIDVLLFPSAPRTRTVASLETAPDNVERLVLLYDDLDANAGPPELCLPFFSEIEAIRKNSNGRIVVFATGSFGLAALDALLGSPFFSRLDPEILEPFDSDGLARLAEPFERCGRPLSPDMLDSLRLATGGNPGLATFGLQRLWEIDAPSPGDVAKIFGDFRGELAEGYLDRIRDPIFDSDISNAPKRVWKELEGTGGRMTRQRLRELVQGAQSTQRIKEQQVFDMLRSTGLIRASDDAYRRPDIMVQIIPSILTFDPLEEQSAKTSLREQLVADLCDVLASIQRMSLDFFRSDDRNDKRRSIVPEPVFSVCLIIGLERRGWRVERDASSAADCTNIKARHVGFGDGSVIVALKHWGRSEYESTHARMTSSWSEGVEALATVMIADHAVQDWSDAYESHCLKGKAPSYERSDPPNALAGHFVAATDGCPVNEVDHLLVRMSKRP